MSTDVVEESGANEESVAVEEAPMRLSSAAAVVAGLAVVALTAPFVLYALPLGLIGVALLVAGVFGEGSRRWVTLGAASGFGAALVAGSVGDLPAELLLPAASAALIAWDAGQNAIGLGEQIGQHSPTGRAELVHLASSVAVVTVVGGIAYAVYRLAGGGTPTTAIVLLVGGAVLVTLALRN